MLKKILSIFTLLIVIVFLSAFTLAKNKVQNLQEINHQSYYLIEDGSRTVPYLSDKEKAREIVKNAGLPLYKEDKVRSFLPPSWGWGGKIVVERATPIYLKVGSQEEKLVRTWAQDIKELLKEQGVDLGTEDKVKPKLSGQVKSLMTVKVDRLGQRIEKETQPIPYQSLTRPDPNLLQGKTRLGQEGEKGKKELTYEIKVKNGEEVSKELKKEKVIREPVNRIVYYGTKPPVISTRYGEISTYRYPGRKNSSRFYDTGDKIRITNPRNGKSITTTIECGGSSCGPTTPGRIIDLKRSLFEEIEYYFMGVIYDAKIELLAQ